MQVKMLVTQVDPFSDCALSAGSTLDVDPHVGRALIEAKIAAPYEVKDGNTVTLRGAEAQAKPRKPRGPKPWKRAG